ncbi:uncharacterized protein LOC118420201 [Branchiostoma floridae]|uniref:Uncharacterized protein LOC118420201 n=2 Tax=Branchiostoma floridae TaxID=7739 RepID=A0A9J7LJA0_BRAFL|nr:uncharacterized protein LOC118420201 [Branchiostoma floridae]
MKTVTVLFVAIVLLLVYTNWAYGKVHLSAKIAENADIGQQVIRVLPTTPGATEEVLCDIIDGNVHGRFGVTQYCVIVVVRPLDFSINQRYNLTVNVPGTTETCFVDVQVEDVDGYSPIYTETCETPVLANDRAPAQLAFNMATMIWTFPNGTKRRLQRTQEDQIRIESIQSEHNGTYTCTVITEDETEVHARYELRAVNCPSGKRGELCEDDCNCLHGASCDRWAGCVCPPGWTGKFCETKCPDGTYGRGCSGECPCQNGAFCDTSDGQCDCTEGWYGMYCTRPCLSGRYGWRCRQACDCKNNATCHHVDGSCTCAPPWTGQRCDVIQPETSLLPLQISIPLSLTLLGVLAALVALYKWRTSTQMKRDEDQEETQVLLELKSMEENLAQSLQPGWLKQWERKAKDLTLGDLIGQGAFSFIREGRLRTANADVTVVAVKSVRSKDRLCYRAFYREAAMLVALDENCKEQNNDGHPNIIKLFGVITRSRTRCILLEYAAKGDLLQLLKQQNRNNISCLVCSFLPYAVHISRALKELQRLRIAHGDVAARNVLINEDDVAHDGLAHDVYTTTTYISSGKNDAEELLPLKWMALESLETRKFTCESDTWSFGVLLWEIAAFGEEPDYQHEIRLSCPRLVGILRQGYRLQKPLGCPERLYDVMKSCWQDYPSARPEPVELEQKLIDCREEIDPLFVLEKTVTVFFVVIVRLLVFSNWTYGKVHLSAKIAENADIGQQVIRVLPTTPGATKEGPCDIIEGNVHGRFGVTQYCVIVVARPLDFGINQRYNLTVNVPGTTETRFVDIQVEDVDGYPTIYNDTCEMPVLGNDKTHGQLAFNALVHAEWLRGTQEDQIRIESIQSDHNGTYTCTVITENEMEVTARYELQAVNCPPDKRGELCEDDCNCLHDASCDRWAGCICPPGWTGNICETKCQDSTYGRGCNSECPCQNGAVCNPTDGQCNCTEGWYGVHCSRPCLSGRYGWRCRQACECKNNATCHHVDGSCTCAPPWTGRRCDVIQPETSPLPLQISIPLLLTLLGVLVALLALYKWRTTTQMRQDEDQEETQVLLELKSMEGNLAQSLQPGWLKRWERKAKDLTLGDLIGQGAFSFIREGRLRTANANVTVVAVKSVRSKDRLCYRAFYREAAMLVALDENCKEHNNDGHPNIIKFLGVITKSTPKCILLGYAAKGDLLQLLKHQNRKNIACLVGSFLRYAVHISRALKELRLLRIAHGDVAARNVLISEDDVAKLSDFGLAHDVYTTTTYISSGKNDAEELLPLKWMALESLETRKFTCESDTWSFGVLLWEIAAFGEEPAYQHEIQLSCPRLVGILRQGHRLQNPVGCPDRLYDVLKSCWLEDPSARPEPAELEQKLTDCREEIDPLFILEKVTTL